MVWIHDAIRCPEGSKFSNGSVRQEVQRGQDKRVQKGWWDAEAGCGITLAPESSSDPTTFWHWSFQVQGSGSLCLHGS